MLVRFDRDGPERSVASLLPASWARTGWDPAWPGLAGTLGFGELRFFRGHPCQNAPLADTRQVIEIALQVLVDVPVHPVAPHIPFVVRLDRLEAPVELHHLQ